MAVLTHSIYLTTAAGLNIYLSGKGGAANAWNGSGTPWDTQSTSPFQIANNSKGGSWSPLSPTATPIYSGGPPFKDGQTLVSRNYTNVVENIPIQIRGTSYDNCVTLLQLLRKELNTALFTIPCILAVKPSGSTNTGYTEIYTAQVQETPDFINSEARSYVIRAMITLTRAPFFTTLAGAETALSSGTMTNTGTGGSANFRAYSTMSGDLIYDGQPLNVVWTPANSASRETQYVYMASALSRTYSATGAGVIASGDSLNTGTATVPAVSNRAIYCRIVGRFSATGATSQVQARAFTGAAQGGQLLYTSRLITCTGNTDYVDFGGFPLSIYRATKNYTTQTVYPNIAVSTASVTFGYVEIIFYYDWCVSTVAFVPNGTRGLVADQFQEKTAFTTLPHEVGLMYGYESSSSMYTVSFRGTLPKYYSGAGLYVAWENSSSHGHETAATSTVSATHSPLWLTMRGAD